MYRARIPVLGAFIALIVGLCHASSATAQDPVEVDPQHFKLLFENEVARVLEVTVEAGGKVPTHSHPSGFAYALSDFDAKTILPDSTVVAGKYKTGQFTETAPVTHVEENTGVTTAHLMLIEFKVKPD